MLEIGIGTGPNLKCYVNLASGPSLVGVHPNRKMEKYAKAAAQASGLPPTKFKFIHVTSQNEFGALATIGVEFAMRNICVEFAMRSICVDDKVIKAQIWDNASQ